MTSKNSQHDLEPGEQGWEAELSLLIQKHDEEMTRIKRTDRRLTLQAAILGVVVGLLALLAYLALMVGWRGSL